MNLQKRRYERGFTLIEILVVVVIVGVLATLVVSNLTGTTEQANLAATQSDIQQIESAAMRYKLANKKWPEEIQELVGEPDDVIRYLDDVPVDKWTGNEYRLERRGNGVIVYCDGADGEPETEDDLTSDNVKKMTVQEYLEIIKQTSGR